MQRIKIFSSAFCCFEVQVVFFMNILTAFFFFIFEASLRKTKVFLAIASNEIFNLCCQVKGRKKELTLKMIFDNDIKKN